MPVDQARAIPDLLADLAARDIHLRVEGEALKVNAGRDALTPELQAMLRARKPEVFAFLQAHTADADAPGAIPVRDRSAPNPLSFGQERLWFLDRLEDGSDTYNMPTALRLCGPVDPDALRRTLRMLVERHEVLRTVYPDGQRIAFLSVDAATPAVDPESLDRADGETATEAIRRVADAEARTPFDLQEGPLLRCRLVCTGDAEHILLLTMHHIVTDGWSIGLFVREFRAGYNAFARGETPDLPPLPVQFADYAAWQRERMAGARLERELAWWRDQLDGAPERLELPTDRPRPPVQTYRGHAVDFALPADATAALRALCRDAGATPFMATLAAFGILLARHTGQGDLLVGSPIANRTHPQTEGLLGYFANTLALRLRPGAHGTVRDYLREVKATLTGAYEHQDLPFEQLVEALRPARDLAHNPLVQVVFALQNAPHHRPFPELALHDLAVEALPFPRRTVTVDLEVHLWEIDGALTGHFVYNTDLFDKATMERLAARYRTLLTAFAAHPDDAPTTLPLLPPEEAAALAACNRTEQATPLPHTMTERFAAQVRERPDAIALVAEDERLRYRDLEARANRLAHALRAHGVEAETRVAVRIDRRADLVVALLGVLKAGGAYVPIDPAYPADRVASILADTQAPVVVTTAPLAETLPPGAQTVLRLDADADAIAAQPTDPPAVEVRPDGLAYVIFTSGSTGRPKGVQIEHRSVCNLLSTLAPSIGVEPDDVWTVFHSFGFDYSVWETWGALLSGGRLVLVPDAALHDPGALLDLLHAEAVTLLNLTPSVMRGLLDAAARKGQGPPASLRLVCSGGEAFPLDLAAPLLAWGRPVWNLYGPTEATVWTSIDRIADAEAPITIGRPLANYTTHIIDAFGQPAPVGVEGELLIGGAGLARGYEARPDLNRERFVHRPAVAPGRLYRTGDLARRLPDGRVLFLGRNDFQVKLRGFRIELGEIEAVLARHPAVRETVVVKRTDAGTDRLVAYLTPVGNETPAADALRAHLRATLPEYMVPAAFVPLDALPLSRSGKVDRGALPAPDARRDAAQPCLGPRTETETMLAALWRETLGLDQVGVEDNFFDLGGHSLLLMRVHEGLEQALGRSVPVLDLFRHPTIAQLAARLDADGDSDDGPTQAITDAEDRAARQRAARQRRRQRRPDRETTP